MWLPWGRIHKTCILYATSNICRAAQGGQGLCFSVAGVITLNFANGNTALVTTLLAFVTLVDAALKSL